MTEHDQNHFLLGSLEKSYLEERKKFEETRASEKNRELLGRIIQIIQKAPHTSDDVHAQRGAYDGPDTLNVTSAALMYAGQIEIGETVVVKYTDWVPYGQKEISGQTADLSIRFQRTDFVKLGDQPQTRLSFVAIEGKLTDKDGVSADFPLVSLREDPKTNRALLFYNFGNEIPFGSEDYLEIEKIIQFAEQQLATDKS